MMAQTMEDKSIQENNVKVNIWRILIITVLAAYVLFFTPVLDYTFRLFKPPGSGTLNAPVGGIELKTVAAPEFPKGMEWLNVDEPIRLKDLRGKIVLLDFWTYCCINCIHIIPDLKRLEKKYPNELVVIGVHSAKFNNEKETENIRQAILRYEIEHPVVNDLNFEIWNLYGARGWPHMVLIDPDGHIVGYLSGEGHYNALNSAISNLVAEYKGQLNLEPIPLALEKDKEPPSVLAYPGKVYASKENNLLLISDSNNNRIIISDLDGKVLDIAGDGKMGAKDGSFDEAQFDHPQGLTMRDNRYIYVADTENHLIRLLDLEKRTVETIAGTGKQTFWWKAGPALETGLNSPWDVIFRNEEDILIIANAGQHQIWQLDLKNQELSPIAGSGREGIHDNVAKRATLAQPSGLATDGTNIYFADSEVSGIRKIDYTTDPISVKTLIGTGLFDFGDKVGSFTNTRLQHVLGVVHRDNKLYIADTYNHRIKVLDLETRQSTNLVGTGTPGIGTVQEPMFYEPSGLALAGYRLYIADTNNNAIRVMDLNTKETTTLTLDMSDWYSKQTAKDFSIPENAIEISSNDQAVPTSGKIKLSLQFPPDHHLNPLAKPMVQMRVTNGNGEEWISPRFTPQETQANALIFQTQAGELQNPQKIEALITYYFCRDDNQGRCYIETLYLTNPLRQGGNEIEISHTPSI